MPSVTMSGYSVIPDYGDPLLMPNPPVPDAAGVRVMGGLRSGSVATCLLYVARRWNTEVEPLVQAYGVWGYDRRTIASSGSWSNHSAGAAIDLNATLHPQHAAGTLSAAQLGRVAAIEASVNSALEWGGRWSPSDLDAMHWQVRNGHAGAPVDELARRLAGTTAVQPPPAASAPAYPFVRGDGRYFGPYSGPAASISGSGPDDARYRPALAQWQAQAVRRGFGTFAADGYFGPITETAARRVQSVAGIAVDGLIGWDTWHAVWA